MNCKKNFFRLLQATGLLLMLFLFTACTGNQYPDSLVVVFKNDDYPQCEVLIEDLQANDYYYRVKDATDPNSDEFAEMMNILESHDYSDSTIDYPVVYVNDTVLFDPDLVEIEEALSHTNI